MGKIEVPLSAARGRLFVVLAALMWSTSGAFTKLLREDTGWGLNVPEIHPLQLAAARVFFPGILLATLLRRRDLTFRPALVGTALIFAVMNTLFVSALALGTAASAIYLQYTAPMWMYLACIWFLGEPADWRGAVSLVIGLTGIGLIIVGGWEGSKSYVILLGLGSGITYAGVLVGLRMQRGASPIWLTVVNCLTGTLVLVPFVLAYPLPSVSQLIVLVLFGVLQLAVPYVLMARALQSVSPQEAGTLTLLEPLLNPLWAWLVSPRTEQVGTLTLAGGAIILSGLAWRYWPRPAVLAPSSERIAEPESGSE
jgi:drug/metabolite transporter, DME family